jgi:TrpR-related protein YerC/YecD
MPQISKVPMEKGIERKVMGAFMESLVRISSNKEMERYLLDLLTPTEQVMLAKRLAIAALFVQGATYKEVAQKLSVSTATVARVNLWLRSSGAGYKAAVEKIKDWKPLT